MGQGTQRPEETSPSNPTATSSTDVISTSDMQGSQEVAANDTSETPASGSHNGPGAKASTEGGVSSDGRASASPAGEEPSVTQGGSSSSSSRPAGGAPAAADPSASNLHFFHAFVTFDSPQEGNKVQQFYTRKKAWKKECLFGNILRYRRKLPNEAEELTVVKDMQSAAVQRCRRYTQNDQIAWTQRQDTPEDALNEIGVYAYFRRQQQQCPYLLRMLDFFLCETTKNDKTEERIWLVLENCEGGDLFDRIGEIRREGGGLLPEAALKRYVLEILQAVRFLHAHNVGHRDISLENLLLRQGHVRLMDFGQAVLLRNDDGQPLYYFRTCGKDYYRAPEVYIPSPQSCPGRRLTQVPVPGGWTPGREVQVMGGGYLCLVRFPADAVPGTTSDATLSGYPVSPIDVFACGVAMFILHAQVQPWKMALMADRFFAWVYTHGTDALLNSWQKPLSPEASRLLSGMLHVHSAYRWTVEDCLASPWFADVEQGPTASTPGQTAAEGSESAGQPATAGAQASDASAGYG